MRQVDSVYVETQVKFQFTHPGKGATLTSRVARMLKRVSIHAPWEGCDVLRDELMRRFGVVSIHAPWEGCDGLQIDKTKRPRRFNSRTLGRVRQRRAYSSGFSDLFQFTHPGKGATVGRSLRVLVDVVSIHAPWEGCDLYTPQ